MEKRGFSLDITEDKLMMILDEKLPEKEFDDYKSSIMDAVNKEREYSGIGTNLSDSKLELELLGTGRYSKEYTVVIDMSNCLDYILHRLTGCSMESIRSMKDYDRVSYSLLNLRTDLCPNVNYSVLCNLDPLLDKYIADKYVNLKEQYGDSMSDDEILGEWVYYLYLDIYNEVNSIKSYAMAAIKQEIPSLVYRSKGFTTFVGSADEPCDATLTLHQDGFSNCDIHVKSYKFCEYIKEVRYLYESFR